MDQDRYTVKIISRRTRDQFAYVQDAVTGDVAKAFTGPDAIAEAEAEAARANAEAAKAPEPATPVTREQALTAWGRVWAGNATAAIAATFQRRDYAASKAEADRIVAGQQAGTSAVHREHAAQIADAVAVLNRLAPHLLAAAARDSFGREPTNADPEWTTEQEERAAGLPSAQAADYSEEPLEN